ncbi:MAG: Cof subfamily protein (haloacid dehalogenase superfamily) [Candidatus Endobugula sp.]|jgi:Cof subfamily protein (haloacid dehalogenase superfamily)
MTLIVFDLDGTLLNNTSTISTFTRDTLRLLRRNDIAYTVATGRTFNTGLDLIDGHHFSLPQIYSNGVIIWNPQQQTLFLDNCLTADDVHYILETSLLKHITPFISAVDHQHKHYIFHPMISHEAEKNLLHMFRQRKNIIVLPLSDMPSDIQVTNISMIGEATEIDSIHHQINTQTHLIAYSGPAIEGDQLKWMDIHHSHANKGSAVTLLREQLNVNKVICFGDSDNDLSMFAVADESYATENAKAEVKEAASGVIGHHHEDGVAHYLRERFSL